MSEKCECVCELPEPVGQTFFVTLVGEELTIEADYFGLERGALVFYKDLLPYAYFAPGLWLSAIVADRKECCDE